MIWKVTLSGICVSFLLRFVQLDWPMVDHDLICRLLKVVGADQNRQLYE